MIEENHNFPDFIDKILIDIADCIDYNIKNYENILLEIGQITNGVLNIQEVTTYTQGEEWRVKLNIDGEELDLQIVDKGKFLDPTILDALNEWIKKKDENEKRNIVNLFGGIYDFAIAFTTLENEQQLAKDDLIWRSGDWKKNQEYYEVLESYSIKENVSEIALPEIWVGFTKYDKQEVISLFKLIIQNDSNGEISGVIHEGNDFYKEKRNYITFQGKREGNKFSFLKTYGDGLMLRLAQTMKLKEDEITLPKKKNIVRYSGEIKNSNFASGTWDKDKTEIEMGGVNWGEDRNHGTWEMKLVQ